MKVPYEALSPAALRGVIEEYVTREGTDYGMRIYNLDEKVAHVQRQLKRGEVAIVFDPDTETCNIIPAKDLAEALAAIQGDDASYDEESEDEDEDEDDEDDEA